MIHSAIRFPGKLRSLDRWFFIFLSLLSLAGMAVIFLSTHLGVGLMDDSYYYIKPALDVAAGKGFNPSSMFAPLLPALLLIFSKLGIEPLFAGRLMNIILYGVDIFFVGLITRQLTHSPFTSLAAAFLVLCSENLVDAQSWLMSEAVFFTGIVLSMWTALRFIEKPDLGRLVIVGVITALTCLGRYAGMAIIPAFGLCLLIDRRSHFLRRIGEAALYAVISFLPIGLYFLRNLLSTGLAARYTGYEYAPFTLENLNFFLYNVLSWFIPGRFLHGRELLVSGMTVITGGVLLFIVLHAGKRPSRQSFLGIICLSGFVFATFTMLYLARGYSELGLYNNRFLNPLLLVILPLISYAAVALWRISGRYLQWGIVLLCLAFCGYYAVRTAQYVSYTYTHGLGYANVGWHNSETIPYLKQNPQLNLVSTAETGIYFWTGRLPTVIGAYGGVDALHQHLCSNHQTLVIMEQMPTEIYGMAHDEVIKGLQLVKQFNDSEIYTCAAGG